MIRATKNGKKQEGDGTEEGNGEQGWEVGGETRDSGRKRRDRIASDTRAID